MNTQHFAAALKPGGNSPAVPSILRLRARLDSHRRDLGVHTLRARVAVATAVDPAHRSAARQLVTAGYATLAGDAMTPGEVVGDLFETDDVESQRALCVVARTSEVLLATATLSLPEPGGRTEALRLFRRPGPWQEVLGVQETLVGEMGRFAMAPLLQRAENRALSVAILRELVELMLGAARDAGLARVVAIMPLSTLRMTAQTGLRFHLIADAELDTANTHFMRLFNKYPRYWLPSNPKLRPRLFWFEWPPEDSQRTTREVTPEAAHG